MKMKISIGAAVLAVLMLAAVSPAQAADGPAFCDARYCDGGNGTVTDTVTGLIWLKQANCFPMTYWKHANEVANTLASGSCGLTDGSSPGDWRLPTTLEWQNTINRALALGCHTVPSVASRFALTDRLGTRCFLDPLGSGTLFIGLTIPTPAPGPVLFDTKGFWTSMSEPSLPNGYAMRVRMDAGTVTFANKFPGDVNMRVWPVRNGRP